MPLAVVFTDPQMATIGTSRAELETQYGGYEPGHHVQRIRHYLDVISPEITPETPHGD